MVGVGVVDHQLAKAGLQQGQGDGAARSMRHARRGDSVRVASMDCLARSVVDLAQIVVELTGRGVRVEFVAERLPFDPGG